MTLIKTSVLTAISTIITVISAFIINKVVAIYAGPTGLALIGQLKDFVTMLTNISNGAITQGVVKYTAEYQTIKEKQKIFSTSIIISLISSFIIAIILFGFSEYLSELILKDIQYSSVFLVFGSSIFLFALNTVLISILNGQKEIKKYVLVNIVNSIVTLILTSLLVVKFNIQGALYALVINQSIVFFVTLMFVLKSVWFKWEYFKQGVDKDSLVKLSKYSLMAITSAIAAPVSFLIIRNHIGENLGWDSAGYWQGIWYISSMYLLVVTTSLSVYYLPKLSEIQDKNELKKEIFIGYKIIMPIVAFMSLVIFLLKEYVILIAFSDKFMPMIELFKWQLIGDIIKIASWLLAYLMLAKAMTKVFVTTEIIFSVLFVCLSILFINSFGLVGITYAFSLNYLLYLITMIFIFKKRFL
ncbi:O-antigen translocase [Aliarcobacter cryaerophilus]|uniref:O-antigen translocase n=1 Tax=Aliarcobacter cryaerophilus TaxID=28198 RepID=UPI0021B5AE52|nr:O-antigen translocase [Aliarcobacter cryaerophilus]MCT7498041.1 O-antigen translocase [Aliarcobacter cryaerophilus]